MGSQGTSQTGDFRVAYCIQTSEGVLTETQSSSGSECVPPSRAAPDGTDALGSGAASGPI